jgi:hypothetical protein
MSDQQSPDERTVDPEDRDAQPLDEQQHDAETEEDTASGGAPQPPA